MVENDTNKVGMSAKATGYGYETYYKMAFVFIN